MPQMKLLNFLVRKEGTTREQFEEHWYNVHAPLVKKHAEALKLRRYIQVHATNPEAVRAMNDPRSLGASNPMEYDGVVEVYWDSAEEFLESFQTEEGKIAWKAISDDEPNFAQYSKSYTYVGEEKVILA